MKIITRDVDKYRLVNKSVLHFVMHVRNVPEIRSIMTEAGYTISHLCGSSCGSLWLSNRREPQKTANIPSDELRVSVTICTFCAYSLKLNVSNFPQEPAKSYETQRNRENREGTVFWPQSNRAPPATFRKKTAAFRKNEYLRFYHVHNSAVSVRLHAILVFSPVLRGPRTISAACSPHDHGHVAVHAVLCAS